MMEELNAAAHSYSVAAKQIVATDVCGDNISRAAITRATKISKRQLRIGSQQRAQFRQIKGELDAKVFEKECQETKDDDSGAGTDDDTSDSSVSDSNSDSNSDSDGDSNNAVDIMLPDQPRNKGQKNDKNDLLQEPTIGTAKYLPINIRKIRSDKRNYEMVNDFLHNDQNDARLDTDKKSKRILIRKTKTYGTGNVRYLSPG
jgi:hypothetical protein